MFHYSIVYPELFKKNFTNLSIVGLNVLTIVGKGGWGVELMVCVVDFGLRGPSCSPDRKRFVEFLEKALY